MTLLKRLEESVNLLADCLKLNRYNRTIIIYLVNTILLNFREFLLIHKLLMEVIIILCLQIHHILRLSIILGNNLSKVLLIILLTQLLCQMSTPSTIYNSSSTSGSNSNIRIHLQLPIYYQMIMIIILWCSIIIRIFSSKNRQISPSKTIIIIRIRYNNVKIAMMEEYQEFSIKTQIILIKWETPLLVPNTLEW